MSIALLLLGAAQALGPAAVPVEDPVLARERGGFTLPGGIDVALTVQTQTAINGTVVLHTVFQASQGTPTFVAYAPRPGEPVAAPQSTTAPGGGTPSAPVISYDSRTGIHVTPGSSPIPVSVGGGAAGNAPPPDGLQQIAGGATDNGAVTVGQSGATRTVELRGADLTVTHLAGGAFGSAIANMGSDRAIDTRTSVAIDLSNAGPDVLGSAMLRVQDIAGTAGATRGY